MRRLAVGLMVAACSSPAPRRPNVYDPDRPQPATYHVDPRDVAEPDPATLLPRPTLAIEPPVLDFHDELRWPLTPLHHPVLEPHFDIAHVFAQPGVGWVDLCARGVQNRYGGDKALLSYLRGWCSAINRDADGACTNLVPLLGSNVPHLDEAVRVDLANILADAGHAEEAQHLINAHHIRDVAMLDLLAANYVEVGTAGDALAINRDAIDSDDHASLETKCTRWTKQIVLEGARKSPLLSEIEKLSEWPFQNPVCAREYSELRCWANNDCDDFYRERGFDPFVVEAYDSWPNVHRSVGWWVMAKRLSDSRFTTASSQLTIAAIFNAIQYPEGCPNGFKSFAMSAVALRRQNTTASDPHLDAIETACAITSAPKTPAAGVQ